FVNQISISRGVPDLRPRVVRYRYCSPSKLLVFELELGLVFFKELAKFVSGIQQTDPLFIIKCHRKTPETVDAYSSLFADPEFQTAAATRALLLFQLRQASLQLFVSWFSHALPREIMMWWLHHRVSAPDSSRGMLRLRCFAFPRSGNLGLPSGSSSAVERQLPKLDVTGSIPVSRSNSTITYGWFTSGCVFNCVQNPWPLHRHCTRVVKGCCP